MGELRSRAIVTALALALGWPAAPLPAQAKEAAAGGDAGIRELPTATADAIDRLFRRWDRPESPGAAVAVIDGGRIVHAAGYGSADLEHDVPITPRTVFHVASVSKQFTAFAILRLAEAGKLSLADDIRRHLEEVPFLGERITIRNLLHHTSGLRDQWTLLMLAGWRLDDVITQQDILRLVSRQGELNFPPGTEYSYSNTGYTLLAEIVSRVAGRPFQEWLAEEVFAPLEMEDTHAHADHRTIVPRRAESYVRLPSGMWRRAPLNYATVGATSLFTTAEDLARWLDNLMAPWFAPDVVRRMDEVGRLRSGAPIDYAFGLVVGELEGLRVVEHSGGDAGFRSHVLAIPDRRLGVVVLANEAQLDPGGLAHRIAEIVLEGRADPAEADTASPASDAPPLEPAVELTREARRAVEGLYWNPVADYVRRIRYEGGRLLYDRGDGNASPLRPIGARRFRMLGVGVPLYVRFEPATGPAERMLARIGDGPPVVAHRTEPAILPTPAGRYTGLYRSPELGVVVEIAVLDDALELRHPRHGPVTLKPVAKDRFESGAWWLGSVRFEADEEGAIRGFRSTSGRVRHLRFDRLEADGEGTGRFSVP